MHAETGIIGGSGLYDMAELTDRREHVVSTPFGEPSGPLTSLAYMTDADNTQGRAEACYGPARLF